MVISHMIILHKHHQQDQTGPSKTQFLDLIIIKK